MFYRSALIFLLSLTPTLTLAAEEWSPNKNQLINVSVSDQTSQMHKFYEDLIRPNTVAINFIFTSCTSSCALSTAIFKQVQRKINSQKLQLLSITVDPTRDTPERLLEFSKQFKAQPNWLFLTGEKAIVDRLLKTFEVYSADKNNHSNIVVVGNDKTNQWTRLYGLPQVDEIIAALNPLLRAH